MCIPYMYFSSIIFFDKGHQVADELRKLGYQVMVFEGINGDRIVHHRRIRQSFGINQRRACCGADGFGHLLIASPCRTELETVDAIAVQRDRADGFAIKQIASCGGIEDVDGEVFVASNSSTIGIRETALVVDQAGNLAAGEERGG